MIFNTIAASNASSGSMPEFVWIEYYKPSEMFEIVTHYVSTGDVMQCQVNLPRNSGQTTLQMCKSLKLSNTKPGIIEEGDSIWNDLPTAWTYVPGYFCLDGSKWVGDIQICKTGNFDTGSDFVSLRYTRIYTAVQTKVNWIKSIYTAEQTGEQFAKIPLISLMGGINRGRTPYFPHSCREVA